jgi:hypothetical protein
MAIVQSAEYSTTAPQETIDGKQGKLQMDENHNLLVRTRPRFRESNLFNAGAASTTGKIGTIPATTGYIIVGVDCSDYPVEWIDYAVTIDNAWSYQFARANSNALSGTITLADATAVDDGDTFVLNGVTWTAEATEEDVVAADHMFWLGANNAEAAVNLAAALSGAYGPGVTATAAAVDATDVITIQATTATVLQFGQGTSASNEIAWADTTQASLDKQGAQVTGKAATTGWHAEVLPPHYVDGWAWGYLIVYNVDGDAATAEVRAVRH